MKNPFRKFFAGTLFTGMLVTAHVILAQNLEITKTTAIITTSEGTISEFGAQGLVIKTEAGTPPLRYESNETTTYVDENGSPIATTTVRSGLPVTVYYTRVGDTLVASKVMVRKMVRASAPEVFSSMGTISESGPERIIVGTGSSSTPLLVYLYSKTTTYVDEDGHPVSIEAVKSGLPVTVHYTREGDVLTASRIIVRRTSTTTPLTDGKTRTKTTTTTVK